jgi:hypothetical protein
MFNLAKSSASEFDTSYPSVSTVISFTILIILFTILVVILRAWKNLISDGFKPVGPFLITISL